MVIKALLKRSYSIDTVWLEYGSCMKNVLCKIESSRLDCHLFQSHFTEEWKNKKAPSFEEAFVHLEIELSNRFVEDLKRLSYAYIKLTSLKFETKE